MNKRIFLKNMAAGVAVGLSPMSEALVTLNPEEHLAKIMTSLPINGFIQVIKVKENEFIIYGAGIETITVK